MTVAVQSPKEKKTSIVANELKKIYDVYGHVTAEILLSEAEENSHPLHNYFEWDDSVAAHSWRINQARAMIISQKYVFEVREKKNSGKLSIPANNELRKFLPDQRTRGKFKTRAEVLSEKDSREILIEKKIVALKSWCNSVSDIKELSKLRELILDNIK